MQTSSAQPEKTGVLRAAYALLVGAATLRALARPLWDDALFFQRVGFNIVHSGVAAWNVEDGPVHGNTSQLLQLMAAGVVALGPGHYHLGVRLLLAACLYASFCLALSRERRAGSLVFCAFCAPPLLLLLESGMETLLACACVCLALWVAERARAGRFASEARELSALVASQLLVYLARPDLLLLSGLATLPLAKERARYARFVLALGVALGLTWLALHAYYGSALPLPFHVKNRWLTHYDAEYQSLDRAGALRQLGTWLLLAAPLVYIALHRPVPRVLLPLGAALALIVYHELCTLQIMGYHARFYLPALFPVLWAARLAWPSFARASGYLRRVLPLLLGWLFLGGLALVAQLLERRGLDNPASWISAGQYATFLVPSVCWLSAPLWRASWQRRAPFAVAGAALLLGIPSYAVWPRTLDDAQLLRETARVWPGLLEVQRCIGEPTHIYQTEIGLPGALFLRSRVTDLSGLMNAEIAQQRTDVEALCLRDPPQVLFLPHFTHRQLNEKLLRGACIRQFTHIAELPPSSTPLFVRTDLVAAFRRCLRDMH